VPIEGFLITFCFFAFGIAAAHPRGSALNGERPVQRDICEPYPPHFGWLATSRQAAVAQTASPPRSRHTIAVRPFTFFFPRIANRPQKRGRSIPLGGRFRKGVDQLASQVAAGQEAE